MDEGNDLTKLMYGVRDINNEHELDKGGEWHAALKGAGMGGGDKDFSPCQQWGPFI